MTNAALPGGPTVARDQAFSARYTSRWLKTVLIAGAVMVVGLGLTMIGNSSAAADLWFAIPAVVVGAPIWGSLINLIVAIPSGATRTEMERV